MLEIQQEVRQLDNGYKRFTLPVIYNAYKEYVAQGNHPYVQVVSDYLMAKFNLPEDLSKQMYHEAYLCNQQAHKEKDEQRARDMEAQGYKLVSWDKENGYNVAEGEKYELVRNSEGMFGGGLQKPEKVRVLKDANEHLFLMPMRNTRTGYFVGHGNEYWVK